MPKIYNTQQMVEHVEDLIDTSDVTEWENGFLKSISKAMRDGKDLTEKQYDVLNQLHYRHFG